MGGSKSPSLLTAVIAGTIPGMNEPYAEQAMKKKERRPMFAERGLITGRYPSRLRKGREVH